MTLPEPPPTPAQFEIPPLDPLKRYSPEQVADNHYMPYSARMLREKAYKQEIYHHKDGGRITFTAEDILRNSRLGAVEPFIEPKAGRSRRQPARAAA
ncbi:hypothetical protein ACF061_01140 [Streptomyces sp. NPDC015220]|uniref:hypothetical protein n=1 Tax=Streptomyces sp. NPDC015220 TaxID=3364947 RepID=UPI0036F82E18